MKIIILVLTILLSSGSFASSWAPADSFFQPGETLVIYVNECEEFRFTRRLHQEGVGRLEIHSICTKYLPTIYDIQFNGESAMLNLAEDGEGHGTYLFGEFALLNVPWSKKRRPQVIVSTLDSDGEVIDYLVLVNTVDW